MNILQIGSDTFELLDGVVGLAFSARLGTVYYQPLATDRLFSVPTTALQAGPLPFGEQLPVTLVGKKSSQGLALAVDPRDDAILFSPFTETAIAAWQPQTNQQRYHNHSVRTISMKMNCENNLWTINFFNSPLAACNFSTYHLSLLLLLLLHLLLFTL